MTQHAHDDIRRLLGRRIGLLDAIALEAAHHDTGQVLLLVAQLRDVVAKLNGHTLREYVESLAS